MEDNPVEPGVKCLSKEDSLSVAILNNENEKSD